MNRLAPLIDRAPPRSGSARAWAVGAAAEAADVVSSDVRLFVTAFLGGIVFFGTMIA